MGILTLIEVLAVPYVVVAVAIAGLGIVVLYRCLQASDKIKEWQDPINEIIADRQKCAPEKGDWAALICRQVNIKWKVVHADKVKNIWWESVGSLKKEFEKVIQSRVDETKETFVDKFFTVENPLAKESVNLAYNANDDILDPKTHGETNISYTRESVESVSNHFSIYFEKYTAINAESSEKITAVNIKRNELLKENQDQWDRDLSPYKDIRDLQILAYQKKLEYDLKPYQQTKQKAIDKAKKKYKKVKNSIYSSLKEA